MFSLVYIEILLCVFVSHMVISGLHRGPYKCYVMPLGVGGCQLSRKKGYEGVRFNVIRVMRGWMGVKFPGKNIS